MNKDRLATVALATSVASALGGKRAPRITQALRSATEGLLRSERAVVKGMEPYKDRPSTRSNYARAQDAVVSLESALEALQEGDHSLAADYLSEVL